MMNKYTKEINSYTRTLYYSNSLLLRQGVTHSPLRETCSALKCYFMECFFFFVKVRLKSKFSGQSMKRWVILLQKKTYFSIHLHFHENKAALLKLLLFGVWLLFSMIHTNEILLLPLNRSGLLPWVDVHGS